MVLANPNNTSLSPSILYVMWERKHFLHSFPMYPALAQMWLTVQITLKESPIMIPRSLPKGLMDPCVLQFAG
jgi:hypothetical protein